MVNLMLCFEMEEVCESYKANDVLTQLHNEMTQNEAV